MFATKFPSASLLTIVFAIFEAVADCTSKTAVLIDEELVPPTLLTIGDVAVPPKSPDNMTNPFTVKLASGVAVSTTWSTYSFVAFTLVYNDVLEALPALITSTLLVNNSLVLRSPEKFWLNVPVVLLNNVFTNWVVATLFDISSEDTVGATGIPVKTTDSIVLLVKVSIPANVDIVPEVGNVTVVLPCEIIVVL